MITFLVGAGLAGASPETWDFPVGPLHVSALEMWLIGAALVGLAGWWMLTTPEFQDFQHRRMLSARRIARTSYIAMLFAASGLLFGSSSRPELAIALHLGLIAFLGIAAVLGLVTHVGHLAERLPNDELTASVHLVRFFTVLLAAGLSVVGLTALFDDVSAPLGDGMFPLVLSAGCLSLLSGGISAIGLVMMMFLLWSHLHAAAREARRNWDSWNLAARDTPSDPSDGQRT